MNDFESELKKQTVRRIPSHWRRQILSAATRDLRQGVTRGKGLWSWRDLFWPAPRIWAALAAAWAVVLFLNLSSGDLVEISTMASNASGVQRVGDFEERRRLMVELLGPAEGVGEAPFVPRRRSDRSPEASAV